MCIHIYIYIYIYLFIYLFIYLLNFYVCISECVLVHVCMCVCVLRFGENSPAGNGKIHKADSLPKLLQDKPLRCKLYDHAP